MYQNLKVQMAAHNVTIEQLSRLLNVHRGAFTIEEAFVIKDYLFRQFDLSYLFKREVTPPAA